MSNDEQFFQGVVFNLKNFKKIEDELYNFQVEHPEECVPLIPFFSTEYTNKLNEFYVSNIVAAKSFDDYMFNVRIKGFPTLMREFIMKHPQFSDIIISFD